MQQTFKGGGGSFYTKGFKEVIVVVQHESQHCHPIRGTALPRKSDELISTHLVCAHCLEMLLTNFTPYFNHKYHRTFMFALYFALSEDALMNIDNEMEKKKKLSQLFFFSFKDKLLCF